MPEVSRFYGIVIRLHYGDHHPPHFHAAYGGRVIEVDIRTLEVIEGRLPRRALGLVMEWAAIHRGELSEAWDQVSAGNSPRKIAPLP